MRVPKPQKRRQPLLGCIADDFTGATDIAGTSGVNGMRTTVELGLPRCRGRLLRCDCDCAKEPQRARERGCRFVGRSALRWLRDQGCLQFFFKYCSTFDSTSAGKYRPRRRSADG